jgi:hypothetical protein
MPSSEMRRSGWASAESPLHVFSLSLSGEDAQSRSVGGLGWRASFRGLWSQIALRRLARALAAIWRIDERVRAPTTQVRDGCR